MNDLLDILFELSRRDTVGNLHFAADYAAELLAKHCEVKRNGGSVIGLIKGKSDYTVMLDAHIDQVAFVVTDIDSEGFLTVSAVGGIDLRSLPSREVTVHAKKTEIPAVFCSTPPHLASGKTEYDDISKIKLDTGLGKKARDIISLGDFVTFSAEPISLSEELVTGKSFDDRAGVACLLKLAERFSHSEPPVNVAILLSNAEEIGLRGAVTATFEIDADEALAIDVSFGDGIGISSDECGKLGDGAMIGFSPVLDSKISKKLVETAKRSGLKYQTEVMGGKTGTNADVISVSRKGVKTCTVSVPLRNMHTDCEIISLRDLENTCELIFNYIMSGGVKND